MNLDISIVAHKQEIIMDFARSYPDFYYILVGQNPQLDIPMTMKDCLAICHAPIDFKDNIEHHPTLLTFTAWYFIAKNIKTFKDYIGIFEYDIEFKKDIHELEQSCAPNCIICFESKPTLHPIFLQDVEGLYEAIRFVYGYDLDYFEALLLEKNDTRWGATSNCIMPIGFLKGFVDWYMQLVPHIFKYPNHPHFHERAIKIYCLLNNVNVIYKPQYLIHLQANSHGYALK